MFPAFKVNQLVVYDDGHNLHTAHIQKVGQTTAVIRIFCTAQKDRIETVPLAKLSAVYTNKEKRA